MEMPPLLNTHFVTIACCPFGIGAAHTVGGENWRKFIVCRLVVTPLCPYSNHQSIGGLDLT